MVCPTFYKRFFYDCIRWDRNWSWCYLDNPKWTWLFQGLSRPHTTESTILLRKDDQFCHIQLTVMLWYHLTFNCSALWRTTWWSVNLAMMSLWRRLWKVITFNNRFLRKATYNILIFFPHFNRLFHFCRVFWILTIYYCNVSYFQYSPRWLPYKIEYNIYHNLQIKRCAGPPQGYNNIMHIQNKSLNLCLFNTYSNY